MNLSYSITPEPRAHSLRDRLTNTCVDCRKHFPRGRPAVLVVDEIPRTATTTGGV